MRSSVSYNFNKLKRFMCLIFSHQKYSQISRSTTQDTFTQSLADLNYSSLKLWKENWETWTRMERQTVQAFLRILLFYYYMNERFNL